MNIEQLALEQKLAEQEIARQSIADKDRRIWELEKRVEILEAMLNRASAVASGLPQPQPLPSIRPAPRRWAVR